MNMAQWLLSIGMKPKQLSKDSLSSPAIHSSHRTEVWDSELSGSIVIPKKTTKANPPKCK